MDNLLWDRMIKRKEKKSKEKDPYQCQELIELDYEQWVYFVGEKKEAWMWMMNKRTVKELIFQEWKVLAVVS